MLTMFGYKYMMGGEGGGGALGAKGSGAWQAKNNI